jgi:uncharacterized membrane-anchored protein
MAAVAGGGLLAVAISRSLPAQDPPAGEPPAPAVEGAPADPAGDDPEARKKAFFAEIETFGWEREGKGKMSHWAEVDVPPGYRFTAGDGTRKLLRAFGNLVGTGEQGLIAPEDLEWFIVFDFSDDGYVKDDDKDKLDADALMKQKKENEKHANEARKQAGLDALYITGWVSPPHYDQRTHNLEWGLKLRGEEGGESVNYNMKLLGRSGVMDATLVCDPEALSGVLPKARQLMDGFRFQPGETYAEFKKGDKIAQYGLTGLVLGGGAVLAAKSGLLAAVGKFFGKFFKIIIVAVIGVAVAARKFFGGLFGRRSDPHERDSLPPPPPA